ncbi:MAG: tRNA (adenosine(37)-N6)-threonylcarbamoyltransferase complex ATPase subunit type 1 TsaE [Parcubacteria group bacterium RIFCSPHIGHO2_01_FULL_40_30]|nr:MAG: tRNA (adenosine(37)-N6)-threonylcarbamoyltransferase complex ATPase subunit type 1 TsaE [Parcubacteria group bacterium RIFCSPHIGHO2_01_FULL_40_30]
MQSIITESPKETEKFAAQLAKKLINKKNNKALVLALEGELGGGKTTFIKGFSKALKVIEKVLSPTFVLIHKHHLKSGDLYHIDAYRLKSEKDLLKLGIKEIFNNPKNIVLIEWADRVKKIIPKTAIWIRFEHLEKNRRKITIEQ